LKEQKRLKVITELDAGRMKGRDAAVVLGLSLKQVRRLVAAYRKCVRARVDVRQYLDRLLAISCKRETLTAYEAATQDPVRVDKSSPAPTPQPSSPPTISGQRVPKPTPRKTYKSVSDHPWRRYPVGHSEKRVAACARILRQARPVPLIGLLALPPLGCILTILERGLQSRR
jgi:hypothetical protein